MIARDNRTRLQVGLPCPTIEELNEMENLRPVSEADFNGILWRLHIPEREDRYSRENRSRHRDDHRGRDDRHRNRDDRHHSRDDRQHSRDDRHGSGSHHHSDNRKRSRSQSVNRKKLVALFYYCICKLDIL